MKNPPRDDHQCDRTRLAQGSLAAVDECECGMLQVHIGAMTLRVAACAMAELCDTFSQAMFEYERRRQPSEEEPVTFGFAPIRGKA